MALFKKQQPDIPRRRQSSEANAIRPEAQTDDSSLVFRRNRTLTGSTSNNISTTASNNDLASPRTQAHELAVRRRKVTGTLFVILLIGAALFGLLYQFTGTPTIVVSNGAITQPIQTKRYVEAIQNYLDANPVGRLRFALNQNALSEYVSQQLPEVSSVSEKGFSGIGKTDFEIGVRTPLAGWKIGNNQYYVDATGVPFQINYFATPAVQIDDESGVGVTAKGTAIVSDSFLAFVGRAVSASSQYGYTVTSAIIPADTTRQLELRLSGYSFYVKLSIDRGATEQIEDMSRSIKYLVSKGVTPQYIDVRVSGKAFYM